MAEASRNGSENGGKNGLDSEDGTKNRKGKREPYLWWLVVLPHVGDYGGSQF